jgi:hypothetical protein
MSLLTNSLLGKKRVNEFTSTGGVPSSDGAVILNVKPKSQLRPKDPRDKKKLKEGEDIIPDDAEEVASTDANFVNTGPSATGLELKDGERDGGPRSNPNLLPSSLALVAPDCTPGWDKPLSPMALPKSDRKPAAAAPVEPAPSSEPKAERSALDMMKLSRPGKPAGAGTGGDEPNLEHMARSVAASVVQEDTDNPVSIPSGDGLLAQGRPMPDHVQSNASSGLLKRYNFSGG